MQSEYTGNSAKSMYISVRVSLRKSRTEHIDVLLVLWWDFWASVEEVMRHLHALVMARQVLYLGISDTPAWVVVNANMFAKANGLTPFSAYQRKWNAETSDMEAGTGIVPICQDQGMGIILWAAVGRGRLLSKEQREKLEGDEMRAGRQKDISEHGIRVSEALEQIAEKKYSTIQAVALAYLISQSPYMVPIVGVQTVEHVRAMSKAAELAKSFLMVWYGNDRSIWTTVADIEGRVLTAHRRGFDTHNTTVQQGDQTSPSPIADILQPLRLPQLKH